MQSSTRHLSMNTLRDSTHVVTHVPAGGGNIMVLPYGTENVIYNITGKIVNKLYLYT